MEVKFTPSFLNKLETLFAESDYILRYEKGNFKAGYCIINSNKVVVVNKYFSLEGKVTCIVQIIRTLKIDESNLSETSLAIYSSFHQTEMKF